MGANAFLNKQKQREQDIFDAGMRIGIQQCWDFLQLTLRDPEIMGRDLFGRSRLEKVYTGIKLRMDHFHQAFTQDKEADVSQEELDRCLAEIWGKDLTPFYERYSEIKQQSYKKAQKGWRE